MMPVKYRKIIHKLEATIDYLKNNSLLTNTHLTHCVSKVLKEV